MQVAAFNLKYLSGYQQYPKTWQVYVNINVQHSCKILQN